MAGRPHVRPVIPWQMLLLLVLGLLPTTKDDTGTIVHKATRKVFGIFIPSIAEISLFRFFFVHSIYDSKVIPNKLMPDNQPRLKQCNRIDLTVFFSCGCCFLLVSRAGSMQFIPKHTPQGAFGVVSWSALNHESRDRLTWSPQKMNTQRAWSIRVMHDVSVPCGPPHELSGSSLWEQACSTCVSFGFFAEWFA